MALCRANSIANTGAHGLGEDVTHACRLFTQDVRVDPQCHGRVSVTEPGSDDMDRDACQQQGRRVQVAKIVQPGVGERPGRWRVCVVMAVDQVGHERSHGVGVERLSPSIGKDQAPGVGPG